MSTLRERINAELDQLQEPVQKQVLDFVSFLRTKQENELLETMEGIISDNLESLKELAK